MRLIIVKDFEGVTDAVKTEETIWENLEKDHELISDEYVFVKFPMAFTINGRGLPLHSQGLRFSQQIIDGVHSQYPSDKLVFICQHIQVNLLRFPESAIIFTPHSTDLTPFFPLPHYCPLPSSPIKKSEDRSVKFSFQGSFSTHFSRSLLYSLWGGRR